MSNNCSYDGGWQYVVVINRQLCCKLCQRTRRSAAVFCPCAAERMLWFASQASGVAVIS